LRSGTNEQQKVRAYLLGQIAQEDLPNLEQQLLVDTEFYEELSIVEDELIDEYIRAELSTLDRQSFETHFMSTTERREKLRFARALKKHVEVLTRADLHEDFSAQEPAGRPEGVEPPLKKRSFFSFLPFQNPIVSYALSAAILLVVGAASWVAWKNSRPSPTGEVLAVTLTAGLTRDVSDETKKILISERVSQVNLQLLVSDPNRYPRYRAELYEARGGMKFEANDLIATQTGTIGVVTLPVAAQLLAVGDYYVKLSGLTPANEYEDLERYSFQVVRN